MPIVQFMLTFKCPKCDSDIVVPWLRNDDTSAKPSRKARKNQRTKLILPDTIWFSLQCSRCPWQDGAYGSKRTDFRRVD
jgi:hypothetical protein